jgi:hypothetical protein
VGFVVEKQRWGGFSPSTRTSVSPANFQNNISVINCTQALIVTALEKVSRKVTKTGVIRTEWKTSAFGLCW